MVEQQFCKLRVRGSNPRVGSSFNPPGKPARVFAFGRPQSVTTLQIPLAPNLSERSLLASAARYPFKGELMNFGGAILMFSLGVLVMAVIVKMNS